MQGRRRYCKRYPALRWRVERQTEQNEALQKRVRWLDGGRWFFGEGW